MNSDRPILKRNSFHLYCEYECIIITLVCHVILFHSGILMFGFGYFVISSSFSVIRFFGLGLFTKQTIIAWFTSNVTAEDQLEALRL